MCTENGVLDKYSTAVHETAVEKGFWDGEWTDEKFMTKLALVHSEVTEVLEAVRKEQGHDKVLEEAADVFIRLVDFVKAYKKVNGLDSSFDNVVQLKVEKNKMRPHLHGVRF